MYEDNLYVTFNECLATVSLINSIELQSPQGPITGTISYENSKTLKFEPSIPLANDVEYTVMVTTAVQDLSSKALPEELTAQFVYKGTDLIIYEEPSEHEHDESLKQNTYLFQGRTYEPESGLYYYRHRYLHPELGRFLQTDPMGYHDSMNMYQAFNNNPANFVDPMGEETFSQYLKEKTGDMRSRGYSESYISSLTKTFKRAYLRKINRQNAWVDNMPGWGWHWLAGAFGTGEAFHDRIETATQEIPKKTWNTIKEIPGEVFFGDPIADLTKGFSQNVRFALDNGADIVTAFQYGIAKEVYDLTPIEEVKTFLDPNIPAEGRADAMFGFTLKMGSFIMGAEGMQGTGIKYYKNAPATKDIFVIGRFWDTSIAENWTGHQIFKPKKWSKWKNKRCIRRVIKKRQTVYLASPIDDNLWNTVLDQPSHFGIEVEQFINANYERVGNYLHPKSK